jgi:hypothetical protein
MRMKMKGTWQRIMGFIHKNKKLVVIFTGYQENLHPNVYNNS